MAVEIEQASNDLPRTNFSRAELARALYDDRGIFSAGRPAELDALQTMGAIDPSLGRLYEGHFNGVQLVALYGTPEQREAARRDVRAGRLFGVWNTEEADGVRIARAGSSYELEGAKTWASGADIVTRALITARTSDGGVQMCRVPLDRMRASIDASQWNPLGMDASNSYRIVFDGIRLGPGDLIGGPGDYERNPWFHGGALRFAAVHVGIVERLTSEVLRYLRARERHDDPMQQARVGDMRVATQAARNWLRSGLAAWLAFDMERSPGAAAQVLDHVDMARLGIERAALDVLERSIRGVGAHGMLESLPFARLFRDLHMYLRQPAPDATLLRVGRRGMERDGTR